MRIIRKLKDARHGWNGLKTVWREEWHFKYQVWAAILGFIFAVVIGARGVELVALFATLALAVGGEVINTAIEDICNAIQSEHDVRIGKIKDMAQAIVIINSLPAIAVFLWIVWVHLLHC